MTTDPTTASARGAANRRVLGVDPSLTATCTCGVVAGQAPDLNVWKTSSKTSSYDEKHGRMRKQVGRVVSLIEPGDLVVVEGLSHASHGSATRDLAGLWWLLYSFLHEAEVGIAVVPPAVRAKWATGKGNAGKFEVGQHIGKRWADVELRSDDEADALVLASMGLHWLGALPWEPIKPQVEALTKVVWPHLPDPSARGAA